MDTQPLARIGSLSYKCRILIALTGGGALAVLLYILWLAGWHPDSFDRLAAVTFAPDGPVVITAPVRFGMGILILAGFSLFAALLVSLWRVFGRFMAGQIFDRVTGETVRKAGWISLANAVFFLVLPTLTTVLLTVNNPPGQRALSIAFNTQQVLSLLMAGVLLAVGHVLALGAAIDEDSKSIV